MRASDAPRCPYPFGPNTALEMRPEYEQQRRPDGPVAVTMPWGGDGWVALNHADVTAALNHTGLSRGAALGEDVPRPSPMILADPSVLFMDPPHHTRLRRVVSRVFTPRRIELLRPRVQEIVDDLVAALRESGSPADLVATVAQPLSITVICELLGVPSADRELFRGWSAVAMSTGGHSIEDMIRAGEEVKAYLADLLAQRAAAPTGDLLSALAGAADDTEATRDELVVFGVTLLLAGDETTANQLANFVYTLLTEVGDLRPLREHPETLPTAVEELLRYVPLAASAGYPAIAREPVRLGDVLLDEGEAVSVQVAAANRDPQVFDDPDTLKLDREHNPHLAFGRGPHFCVGSQLARLELTVALETLLRELPGLDLAVAADAVPFRTGRLARGPQELMVRW